MAEERGVIMLIDDDETSLAFGRAILESRYTVFPVPTGEQVFTILKKVVPDIVLLDIEMPDMDGYTVFKRLKQTPETENTPVVFLTSCTDPGSELTGLSMGAVDYITKPFSPLLLVQRIKNHLLLSSQKKQLSLYNTQLQKMADSQAEEIRNLQSAILNIVSELVEFRDGMGGGHIKRILKYMETLVNAMLEKGVYKDEIESWDKEAFISAAQMHDVGNIYISENILNKPGKIDSEEYDDIKNTRITG
jgi:putative two-component system response regulator